MTGYRNAKLNPNRHTESCVCGEDIVAETGWEMAAVDEHNRSPKHQAWRRRMGYDKEPPPLPFRTE